MWGNDVHGDCVTAEEAFAKACHDPEIFLSDEEIIGWASRHDVLEGAYIHQVLDLLRVEPFRKDNQRYYDGSAFSVDWTNTPILRSAISQGPVKIGVAADQLLAAYHKNGGNSGWFARGFAQDGKMDHCVTLCGYGTTEWLAEQLHALLPSDVDQMRSSYALFTWNSIGIIDEPSMRAITHEAWLRSPTTVVGQDRVG